MMRRVALVLMMVTLAGCGKKGALMPPEALRPAPVADLRVEQQGEAFLVSWTRPAKEIGGRKLTDLAVMQLFRREVLPPGEDCEQCAEAYKPVIRVDLDYPRGVVISGDRFFWYDTGVVRDRSYRYKVVSANREGAASPPSNQAGRKNVAPPAAPVVTALATPTGVELKWQPPQAPAGGRIEGYNLYRRKSGGTFSPLPLNQAPLQATGFEDTRLEHGVRYEYAAGTVAVIEGETVESERSAPVEGFLAEPE